MSNCQISDVQLSNIRCLTLKYLMPNSQISDVQLCRHGDPPPPCQENAQALPPPSQRHLPLWRVRHLQFDLRLRRIEHKDMMHRYYGENVLHMSCVAEDPSVVKWLLDIGADIDRYRRNTSYEITPWPPPTHPLHLESHLIRSGWLTFARTSTGSELESLTMGRFRGKHSNTRRIFCQDDPLGSWAWREKHKYILCSSSGNVHSPLSWLKEMKSPGERFWITFDWQPLAGNILTVNITFPWKMFSGHFERKTLFPPDRLKSVLGV